MRMMNNLKRIRNGVVIVASALCLSSCGDKFEDADKILEIEFLDVGKADCMLITIDDLVILNDSADEDGFEKIKKALDSRGIKEIDYFIVSHYDKDHIGCADDVMNNYEVDEIIGPDYTEDTENYNNMMNVIKNKDVDYKILNEDYYIDEDGAKIWINAPKEKKYDNDNDYSLITTVEFGKNKFLLTGDALKDRFGEFNSVSEGEYALIKIPHHGEYNKNVREWMTNSKVKNAVITSKNMSTVEEKLPELLKELDVTPYYTYDGNVVARTDGNELEIIQK